MNPLTVDKVSKKFLWEKDSGFLYTKQLIESLPSDWRFTILTPKGFDESFFDVENIECIEYDYSTSIHQNRYHFNRNILAKALPYSTDIDVVLNMQPEVTASIKTFFQNQRREKPIIINYYHWIDCKESRKFGAGLDGFIWRQVEGYNNADLNLFHNEYAYGLFCGSADEIGLPVSDIPVGYFHPLPTQFGDKPIELPDKKIILFNHRLNNSTGWKQVVEACKKLERDDFVLWLTDEQGKEQLDYPWLRIEAVPFESYGYLIMKSHFSIVNLKGYATWNMSVLDSLMEGTPVLSKPDELMMSLGAEEGDIGTWLDEPIREVISPVITDYPIVEWITNEIETRIIGKTPRKYEDVIAMIPCTKSEFVNGLWSFHANSNFQVIRWKLLQVCTDDISQKKTSYNHLNIDSGDL